MYHAHTSTTHALTFPFQSSSPLCQIKCSGFVHRGYQSIRGTNFTNFDFYTVNTLLINSCQYTFPHLGNGERMQSGGEGGGRRGEEGGREGGESRDNGMKGGGRGKEGGGRNMYRSNGVGKELMGGRRTEN